MIGIRTSLAPICVYEFMITLSSHLSKKKKKPHIGGLRFEFNLNFYKS